MLETLIGIPVSSLYIYFCIITILDPQYSSFGKLLLHLIVTFFMALPLPIIFIGLSILGDRKYGERSKKLEKYFILFFTLGILGIRNMPLIAILTFLIKTILVFI